VAVMCPLSTVLVEDMSLVFEREVVLEEEPWAGCGTRIVRILWCELLNLSC
jgi:hypothetical protein